MCGIAGEIRFDDKQADISGVVRMGNLIAHRGPDGAGKYVSVNSRVAFAHRRLAILDPSDSGHQPMETVSGEVIVYNGEIYNYLELRSELKTSHGALFSGNSDTEVLLQGYRHWGKDVIQKLRGMFSFVIYDPRRRRVVIARDRLGIKPLYVAFDNDRLAFCSELDPLREHCGLNSIDQQGLAAFLTYRYIPWPLSIWDGAEKFPPSQVWSISLENGMVQRETYWNLPEIAADAVNCRRPFDVEELQEYLKETVYLHSRSDVPAGVLLSGGLDSSAVGAFFRKRCPDSDITAYSIDFGAERSEIPVAQEVARKWHLRHKTRQVAPDQLSSMLKTVSEISDEPLADSSLIPFYRLCDFASDDVKMVMGGDGGDELFYGYKWYTAHRWMRQLPKLPLSANTADRIAGRLKSPWSLLISALLRSGQDRMDVLHGNPFPREEIVSLLGTAYETSAPKLPGYYENLPHWLQFRLYDLQSFTTDAILKKVDSASMAHGLEVRVPMLDHRLLEYAMTLPPQALYRGRLTKRGLRQSLQRHLPQQVFKKQKVGFGMPMRKWSEHVEELARTCLPYGPMSDTSLINQTKLQQEIEGRSRNKTTRLWTLLVLDTWLRNRSN